MDAGFDHHLAKPLDDARRESVLQALPTLGTDDGG